MQNQAAGAALYGGTERLHPKSQAGTTRAPLAILRRTIYEGASSGDCHGRSAASQRALYARFQREGDRQGARAARRRRDPRPRGFGRARRQGCRPGAGRAGGARGGLWIARGRRPRERRSHSVGRSGPGGIMLAARALSDARAPEKTRLWAMMETPMAILSAGSIAATAADPTARLEVLVMGLNDLAKETRARLTPGRASFSTWLALCVAAARAHGCDIVDGVYNDIGDLDGFRDECEQGREMGLDGKTLIHPSQIEICNAVFAPSATEVESARAIIEAFALPENAGRGVIQRNGRMVERLHAELAERSLAIARRITAFAGAETVEFGSRA